MNDKSIGQRIKAARQRAGVSQTELAAKMGRPYQSIGQWERDLSSPKFSSLEEIADALGITAEELIFGEKAETRDSQPLSAPKTPLVTEQMSPDFLHDFISNILRDVSDDLEGHDPEQYKTWKSTFRPMLEKKISEAVQKMKPKGMEKSNCRDELARSDRVIALYVEYLLSLIHPASEISEDEIPQYFSSDGLRMLASKEGIDTALGILGQCVFLRKDIKRRNN